VGEKLKSNRSKKLNEHNDKKIMYTIIDSLNFALPLFNQKMTWFLVEMKKWDGMRSDTVLKLNIINSKNSPKKKKKHQKINRTYVVVRDVMTVNWNRSKVRQLTSLTVKLVLKWFVRIWLVALKLAYQ